MRNNNLNIIVQKYGGTSVASIQHISNIANNIAKLYLHNKRLIIILSAMANHTNELFSMAHAIDSERINKYSNHNKREIDTIVATGEQITIALLALALQKINIPAKSYCAWQLPITTTNNYNNARIKNINVTNIMSNLEQDTVVIIAGFQGIDESYNITTLGRGGSDTSALAIASTVMAHECQIFTDVNGVYNTDPNKVIIAKPIKMIDGKYMLEAASLGAKVLHPRSCELAYRYKINIRVLSTFAPQDQGSLIVNNEIQLKTLNNELEKYPIINLTTEDLQNLITINHKQYNINPAKILSIIYQENNIDMLQINKDTISFITNQQEFNNIKQQLQQLNIQNLDITYNLSKISLIGSGFRSNHSLNHQVWELLHETEIFASSHNEISISFLVHQLDSIVTRNKLMTLFA